MIGKVVGAKVLTPGEIQRYVRERIGRGMSSAAKFMKDRLRVTVGVQGDGRVRATAGAPPRRITGAGQRSINSRTTASNVVFSAVWYMLYWETHGHPWLRKTIDKYIGEMRRIM